MLSFICLFLPAVISVGIYEGLTKKSLTWKQWGYLYSAGVVLINFFCWLVMRFVLETAYTYLEDAAVGITPAVAGNYMAMALPAAVILPVVAALLSKHAKVSIEDAEDVQK